MKKKKFLLVCPLEDFALKDKYFANVVWNEFEFYLHCKAIDSKEANNFTKKFDLVMITPSMLLDYVNLIAVEEIGFKPLWNKISESVSGEYVIVSISDQNDSESDQEVTHLLFGDQGNFFNKIIIFNDFKEEK